MGKTLLESEFIWCEPEAVTGVCGIEAKHSLRRCNP